MGQLCYGPTLLCAKCFGCYLVCLPYITLFSLCSYNENKIFINTHILTCFFSDEKHFIALYYFMGRVCNGSRVLWAEMSRNR